MEIVPNLRPIVFWLKVRTRGPQPSICVPTFSQFTSWTVSARERYQRATTLSDRLRKQAKALGETLYRGLNERMFALEEQGMADHLVRREVKERKATIDAELQELWQRVDRVEARQDQDWRKQERYCREQREVLRALEDLASKEREMFELDNRKDQVMTVCKVALVNLVM